MAYFQPELGNFLTAVNFSYQKFDGDYFLPEITMKSYLKGFLLPWKDCTEDRLTREKGLI
jgi:hypothetical protein